MGRRAPKSGDEAGDDAGGGEEGTKTTTIDSTELTEAGEYPYPSYKELLQLTVHISTNVGTF
jgi:hypothetical protein